MDIQTPPMQTALVQTKPHEQPCGKEQPGNIRERQEEKRNDFNRVPTPAVHPTDVARQNSGTNPPPRRPEIPRAAYVERAQAKQSFGQKWRDMKWHWFVTFVTLPLIGVIWNCVEGITAVLKANMLYGLFCLAIAIYGAYIDVMMFNFRQGAWIHYLCFGATISLVNILVAVVVSEDATSLGQALGAGVTRLVVCAINYKYYSKRADRFVN